LNRFGKLVDPTGGAACRARMSEKAGVSRCRSDQLVRLPDLNIAMTYRLQTIDNPNAPGGFGNGTQLFEINSSGVLAGQSETIVCAATVTGAGLLSLLAHVTLWPLGNT
jgi:hypothetical protein